MSQREFERKMEEHIEEMRVTQTIAYFSRTVELCFSDCVHAFRSKKLDDKEASNPGTEEAALPAVAPHRATGYARRGDGFSVGETEGLLQLVRDRWQEGWDVIAQVHNQQYPGHNRTGPSLKRKFGKLYRARLDDPNTTHKVARLASLAKDVREEMRGRARTISSNRAVDADTLDEQHSFAEKEAHEPDVEEHEHREDVSETEPQVLETTHHRPLTEQIVSLDRDIRQSLAIEREIHQSMDQGSPLERETHQSQEQSVVLERQSLDETAPLEQEARGRDTEWEATDTRSPLAAVRLRALRSRIELARDVSSNGAPDDELLRTVLLLLMDAQHQRDLEREEEREQRRKEEIRRREEEREERRRHEQERAEDRRRHEQYMQMMTTMLAKIAGSRLHGRDDEI
ncbi:hypothetical protein JM18_000284 [Phytophthora kernoviae]|uniref:Tim10-like domain-containing protein n=2 Tax=Phytophthora kernoviae TaxID=325452 RepID=A0A8T0M9W3_9STRA|nr:hypothetical protein G195_004014 [Phytophthora kernoviae 00238/432]KAG2532443.1 hypothetical protein JM16_000367 [Phytophthora kernoviae]KAG2533411.1 hypothetical protein JM18_000284 [Phytophthora kernoviae]